MSLSFSSWMRSLIQRVCCPSQPSLKHQTGIEVPSDETASAKPERATWVSPYIMVKDVDQAVTFYNQAFSFETVERIPGEDGSTWHAELRYQDQLIMLGKVGVYGSTAKSPIMSQVESPINQYIYVKDVDQFYTKAIKAGAKHVVKPEDMFWGDRMCKLKDLDDYVWCFATFLGEPEKM